MIELLNGLYEESSGGQAINNEDMTITANGEYTASEGYTGIGTATVNVPQPTGTISITANGTADVNDYQYASVNVPQYEERTLTNKTGSAVSSGDKVWVDGSDIKSFIDTTYGDFTKTGSPTITNGVVSGFSTTNYIVPKCYFNDAYTVNAIWEWVVKFNIETLSQFNAILGGDSGSYLLDLYVGVANKLGINLSGNGSSYNIAEGVLGTTVLSASTDYWVKFGWTGSVYYVDLSTDGKTFTREISVNSVSPVTSYSYPSRPLCIGFRVGQYFHGSIDLKETYFSLKNTTEQRAYIWRAYDILVNSSVVTGVAKETIANNASGKVGIGELGKKYGATINNFLGDVNANGVLQVASFPLELVFNGVVSITEQYAVVLPKYHGTQNTVKSASFPDLETISGANSFASTFSQTGIESISFPKLKTISGNYSCQGLCNGSSSGISAGNGKGLKSVTFPSLESISGNNTLALAFSENSNLTSCSFPSLKTWSGGSSTLFSNTGIEQTEMPELEEISTNFFYVYKNAKKLKTATFPKLKTISSFALNGSFEGCSTLESVSFGGLRSSSFSSPYAYFANMLKNLSNVTVHFPSNLQSVIGSWSDVTNGFGGTNTTVLYDLPATE